MKLGVICDGISRNLEHTVNVMDEYDLEYEAGEGLGLVEEPTYIGWGPRTFFVANSGLMPTQFSVIWDSASLNFTIISCSIMALAVLLFS